MSRLAIESVVKRFGAVTAVDRVSLDVADGEFLAVLGPSGCGKTTLLRLIAGFETVDGGRIAFGERAVSAARIHVPPEERRVGIVFQSYALWPHMNVARNVGYALEVAGVKGEAYRQRVAAALATVGLEGYGERRPAQLSGGQRQRVALARCLAMEPAVVLLDEPLANLDVHLRASMLDEFAAFHAKTRATMVYITHDQGEAMALATRIAVMDQGRLAQVAAPRTLYREPASAMVGAFIGRGTVVAADVLSGAGGEAQVEIASARATLRCTPGQQVGPVQVCLRPEDLMPVPPGTGGALTGTVSRAVFRGGRSEIDLAVPGLDTPLRLDLDEPHATERGQALAVALRGGWVIPADAPLARAAE
jgi:iron(III) transport system ATP-binding protein